jgi:hypothetical protein
LVGISPRIARTPSFEQCREVDVGRPECFAGLSRL